MSGRVELHQPEPDGAPFSTIEELRGVLARFDAAAPRSKQREPGPSEIGQPCDRALGYRLAEVPSVRRQNGRGARTDLAWAPVQGTAMHTHIAAALAADNARRGRPRWIIEQRVHVGPRIAGSCDCYDTDTDTVVDWKYVGVTALRRYARQIRDEYRVQAHLYGMGWEAAGFRPRFVRLVFLPRSASFEDAREWTAPYDRSIGVAALERLDRIHRAIGDLDLAAHPHLWAALPASPGEACRYCRWHRPGDPAGRPADATGCPGDTDAEQATAAATVLRGLIPPSTTTSHSDQDRHEQKEPA